MDNALRNTALGLIGGLGLGAGLMYILDPDRGNRRRARARDKVMKTYHTAEKAFGTAKRDISNRASGVVAEAKSLFSHEEVVSERKLAERVRSRLGRVVSHPHALGVAVDKGHVTLSGPILHREVEKLLDTVAMVPGVKSVKNMLELHSTADISTLQGDGRGSGGHNAIMRERWSPTARVAAGLAGGALAYYGAQRHDALGITLGTVGLGLITRSAVNRDLGELSGVDRIVDEVNEKGVKPMMERVKGDGLKSLVNGVTDAITNGPVKSALKAVTGH